jgi:hypothetical protein
MLEGPGERQGGLSISACFMVSFLIACTDVDRNAKGKKQEARQQGPVHQ